MKIFKAHDGQTIEVNQSLKQFKGCVGPCHKITMKKGDYTNTVWCSSLDRLEDLVDCFSLATGTIADSIICMTDQGEELNQDVMQTLIDQAEENPTELVSAQLQQCSGFHN